MSAESSLRGALSSQEADGGEIKAQCAEKEQRDGLGESSLGWKQQGASEGLQERAAVSGVRTLSPGHLSAVLSPASDLEVTSRPGETQ